MAYRYNIPKGAASAADTLFLTCARCGDDLAIHDWIVTKVKIDPEAPNLDAFDEVQSCDRDPLPIRGYVIHLKGKDGKGGSVTFDKYGMNPEVFNGRTDEQALNQAISNALAGAIRQYGPSWVDTYTVVTVPQRGEPW